MYIVCNNQINYTFRVIEPKIKTSFMRLTHAVITDSLNICVWNAIRLRLVQIADYLRNDLIRELALCKKNNVPPLRE